MGAHVVDPSHAVTEMFGADGCAESAVANLLQRVSIRHQDAVRPHETIGNACSQSTLWFEATAMSLALSQTVIAWSKMANACWMEVRSQLK